MSLGTEYLLIVRHEHMLEKDICPFQNLIGTVTDVVVIRDNNTLFSIKKKREKTTTSTTRKTRYYLNEKT